MLKVITAVIFAFALSIATARAQPSADAEIIELRGTVQIQRTDGGVWDAVKVGDKLRVGQSLRTAENSAVTLRFGDLTQVRKGPLTTLTLRAPARGTKPELDIKAGLLYFLGRDRSDTLRIRTPTAAGAIRGTEFSVEVAENGASKITMIEGLVELEGAQPVALTNGVQGIANAGGEIRTSILALEEQREAIQWAFYYPAILDANDLDDVDFPESLAAYREGDLRGALKGLNREPQTNGERIYAGAALLANGFLDASKRALGGLQIPGELAESHRQQGNGNLDSALAIAKKVAESSPTFGFAWARVAELEFSFGHIDQAKEALERALKLSPKFAPALALRGFIAAAEGRWAEAEEYFGRAIELDGGVGNAWLGRGLVRMRQGRRLEGMQDLQTAAIMEPQRAILRSYLGKAHFENGNTANALRELALAMEFEPGDPTAWLYRAILRQQENQINEGIADLERSKEQNKNRAAFRSRLLLDQDQAVRAANLAALYRDAGLREVSVREAGRAVNYDYANASAHLFLASSYDALRDPNQVNLRYETPWQSELLVSQLLAPIGAGTLSQNISQQEYSRLFADDGFGLSGGGRYLTSGNWRQYASQYGTFDKMSYALDEVYLTQEGDAPNTDLEQLSLFATFKQQITSKDSVFGQVIYYHNQSGDVRQYYNPASADTTVRFEEWQEPTILAGYHRQWSPEHNTLFLAGRLEDEVRYSDQSDSQIILARGVGIGVDAGSFRQLYSSEFALWTAEAQHLWTPANHQIIVGARGQTGDVDAHSDIRRAAGPFPPIGAVNRDLSAQADIDRFTSYSYWHWQIVEPFRLIGGVSYDRLRLPVNTDFAPVASGDRIEEKFSPKAGFIWNVHDETWLRGAYTKSLGGVYFDASARLEPVQVAGFTQGFRSGIPESEAGALAGSAFETFGLGLDHRFPTRTYVAADVEYLRASGERSRGMFNFTAVPVTPGQEIEDLDFEERSISLSAHQLISTQFSLGAIYRISRADLDSRFRDISPTLYAGAQSSVEGTLQELRLQFFWNHPLGLFGQAETIWTDQRNRGYGATRPNGDFWQANFWLGYRFERRHAELRVGLLNATDQDYRLSPLNLYNAPVRERTVALELKFDF